MDVMNGQIDRLTAQIQPAIDKVTAALKGGLDQLSADEKAALDTFTTEVSQIIAAESAIVKQINDVLTEQRTAFFEEFDRRVKVSIQIGAPAPQQETNQ